VTETGYLLTDAGGPTMPDGTRLGSMIETRDEHSADALKFTRLRDEWKEKRGPHSSTLKLVMHPAYQTIIGMGMAAVPHILRELEEGAPDSWFWALRAITEANPVAPSELGDGQAMARAWLRWGAENGFHG
jgi:hypothetical protein